MNIPLKKTNILLPNKNIDLTKWTVIACDQYTSDKEYWENVENLVSEEPSTLRLTLPEIYLETEDEENKIKEINKTMTEYLNNNIFTEYKDSIIYVERTLQNNKVRKGIVGMVDLGSTETVVVVLLIVTSERSNPLALAAGLIKYGVPAAITGVSCFVKLRINSPLVFSESDVKSYNSTLVPKMDLTVLLSIAKGNTRV